MHTIPAPRGKSPCKTILVAGLLAGSVDLIFAFFYYGKGGPNVVGVLQSIAGGVLGKATFQGGASTAVLGLVLHYVISFLWASVYLIASRVQPSLLRHAIPFGLGFGALIYFFMNLVVLPISAYHAKAWPPTLAGWVLGIHLCGVGLPIALVVHRFQGRA